MKRPTCRYHCRPCDGHFTSLAAFDAHRVGTPQDRACEDPDVVTDEDGNWLLGVRSEHAVCSISGASERLSVTLYATARDLAKEPPAWAT